MSFMGTILAEEHSNFYFSPKDFKLPFNDQQGRMQSFKIPYENIESFKGLPILINVSIYKVYPENLLGIDLSPQFHFYRFSFDDRIVESISRAVHDALSDNSNVAEAKFMTLNFDGQKGHLALHTLKLTIIQNDQNPRMQRFVKVSTQIDYLPLSDDIVQYFIRSGFKSKDATEQELSAKEQKYRDLIFIYKEII